MYEPLETQLEEILNAKTKAEIISLIQKYQDIIVNSSNLRSFLRTAVDTDNKNLLQALNETKIFESQAILYYKRIDLLNSLANSYRHVYGGDLKLSPAQTEAFKNFKNSDISVINDEFHRFKSSLKVLEKGHPDLIALIKPHFFPENFPSEIIEMAKINTNADKRVIQTEVKKAVDELKNNITLTMMLERANHIVGVKNTLEYDFNIYRDRDNEPRYTAEDGAIKKFLSDFPDKSSRDYQYIQSATGAASMLFHFARSVSDLQKFQKENNNIAPEKLSYEKLEQLAKILNRISNSHDEMMRNGKNLRILIAEHPSQEVIHRLAPPPVRENEGQLSNLPPPTQQVATKPMLRMVEVILHETGTKLENAVKNNKENEFNGLINHMIESGSPDQLQVTLKSLRHQAIRLAKSPEKNTDPNWEKKMSMLTEGIAKLNKANDRFLAPSQESQPAATISKKF